MDWLKIIANVTGLADFWSKYFGDQQKKKDAAKLQQGATDAATLETIGRVNAPISNSESDELWRRNQEKFGRVAGHHLDE